MPRDWPRLGRNVLFYCVASVFKMSSGRVNALLYTCFIIFLIRFFLNETLAAHWIVLDCISFCFDFIKLYDIQMVFIRMLLLSFNSNRVTAKNSYHLHMLTLLKQAESLGCTEH